MYIGQDLQVAYPTYKNIDDISGSFNGSTTSFALLVGGVAPSPLPLNSQQCLISVGGVIQRPDDTGTEGFRLSGGNIVFSSAPNTGEDFFGVILAGADYVNVGANFPSGSAAVPSITFDSDLDTGIYNSAANQVGIACAGSSVSVFSSAGQSFLAGSAGAPSLYPSGDTNTGIWSPAADTIAISTGGSERTRVDSSGRLLVGTSSASGISLLVSQGNTSAGTSYGMLQLARGQAAGASITTGTRIGQIDFTDSGANVFGQIYAEADAATGSGDYPGRIVLATTADGASSPTERMRIGNNGGINTFAATTTLQCRSATGAGTTEYLFAGIYSATSVSDGSLSFRVFTNGNVQNTNNSYGAISDVKLKENIVDASSQWNDLKALQVRKYNFKEGQTHIQIGLIAQEVELVSPGLVTESPDRDAEGNDLGTVTKSVNYSVLYMKAVKALQEAMERIEQLEAKVAALEAA